MGPRDKVHLGRPELGHMYHAGENDARPDGVYTGVT
jgi:hypothetical protein